MRRRGEEAEIARTGAFSPLGKLVGGGGEDRNLSGITDSVVHTGRKEALVVEKGDRSR